jgi:hypothetical protein
VRNAFTLMLAAVIGASAGCGSGDTTSGNERLTKAEYVAQLEAASRRLQSTTSDAADSNFASSRMDELVVAAADVADELNDARPPQDVEDVHAQLVSGLRRFADELRALSRFADETEELDPLDAIARLSELEDSETLEQAARELERRGYDVPAFFTGSG